jgi:serine/threonine-protein kinase
MDAAGWRELQSLFHSASALPAPERLAFVRASTGANAESVLGMLQEDASSSLLDRDLAQIASDILTESPAGFPQGGRFGAYQIRGLLGEGGMGVVYLAERADLGSVVALKVLRDAWMSPARRERFTAEQRTLARLNHPSIARLYDADTLPDGTPWFVMEYVDGLALTHYCAIHNCTLEERLRLFRAVCEAVDYAHRHAVLHRDLKPSNILVKQDGSVRLLDFGIAKQLEPEGYSADHTRTALRHMTLAYAAPEQIRGESTSIQGDVYSLGVIFYELLTGRAPYELAQKSAIEVERLILETQPEKPSRFAATTLCARKTSWADLDILCATAMHKDLAQRYRSVEALVRDLDHYAHREPLEARRDTLMYRTRKFVQRHTAAVASTAFVLLVITGPTTFFVVRLTAARNMALLEAERTKRIQNFTFNLVNGGDKDAGPSEGLRVESLIDRGVVEAGSLSNEPTVQATLYQTLGVVYQNLGKLDQAEKLLQLAVDQRRRLLREHVAGAAAADVADAEISLGLLRSDEARLDEAERLVRNALDTIRHDHASSDPAVLKASTALGKVLETRGKYSQAIDVMQRAVSAPGVSQTDSPELADALDELADNNFYTGHYEICDPLFSRVLAMHRRIYGDEHSKVAEDLIDLGATRMERGRYQESEKFDRQAVAICERFYGAEHPQTASALTQLGRSLYYEKRFEEASALLRRALSVQERVHGPVHPAVASALNELGNIASASGHYDEAEAAFGRMMEIYRTVYHDHHYLIGTAESNLATPYLGQKQYTRAEVLYRDAIRRFSDTLPPTHTNIAIARVKLGRCLLRQKRYREAAQETLAGYRKLSARMNPTASWLVSARKDLRKIYAGLGQPDQVHLFTDPPGKSSASSR